jgi:hypothetical protein
VAEFLFDAGRTFLDATFYLRTPQALGGLTVCARDISANNAGSQAISLLCPESTLTIEDTSLTCARGLWPVGILDESIDNADFVRGLDEAVNADYTVDYSTSSPPAPAVDTARVAVVRLDAPEDCPM